MRMISELDAKQMINTAVRNSQRRASIGFVILFFGTMGAYWTGWHASESARESIISTANAVVVEGCNRDFDDRTALRGVLISAQTLIEERRKAGLIDRSDADAAEAFYEDQLNSLPLPDCRTAMDTVTDKDANVVMPSPKYPGYDSDKKKK